MNLRIEKMGNIKIYIDGILLIEEVSYNNVISTINDAINIIQDDYQLNILNEILNKINYSEEIA